MIGHRTALRGAALAATLVVATACSAKSVHSSAPSTTVVAPTTTAAPPTTAAPSTTVPPTSSTAVVAGPASLGGTCDDVLPVSTVNTAVGQPVVGTTKSIVGAAQSTIGRLIYLFCQYGFGKKVTGKPAPTPQVEITVSLYDTNAHAASRVSGTVDYYQTNGAQASAASLGGVAASILTGYGAPTIVVADGPRTIAVSISKTLTPSAQTQTLTSLATAALQATAHYTGTTATVSATAGASVPGATATPTAAATS